MSSIHLAESDQEIRRLFSGDRELRTHLIEADFVAMVRDVSSRVAIDSPIFAKAGPDGDTERSVDSRADE